MILVLMVPKSFALDHSHWFGASSASSRAEPGVPRGTQGLNHASRYGRSTETETDQARPRVPIEDLHVKAFIDDSFHGGVHAKVSLECVSLPCFCRQ